MSRMIVLKIEGVPIPFKAAFVSKKGSFNPRWKEMKVMREMLKDQYQGPVLEKAITCDYTFYMPIPKSTSKKKRALMLLGVIRPICTPDLDNLRKLYSDILQDIVIKNDSQIVDGRSAKFYGEVPQTIIQIGEL